MKVLTYQTSTGLKVMNPDGRTLERLVNGAARAGIKLSDEQAVGIVCGPAVPDDAKDVRIVDASTLPKDEPAPEAAAQPKDAP